MGGVLLFSLSMSLTSCEGALDDILGEWSRPTPGSSTGGAGTVTSISIDPTLALKVGETGQLTATVDPAGTAVTWSSDKKEIATIDANGMVTAVAVGTATITAKAGDKSATCEVTVSAAFAANEYNEGEWDGTKVVFTKKTAASVTAMTNTTTTWDAGWYTVSGDVTITGTVSLKTDVHLILQDGAKLTITGQIDGYAAAIARNLYIYGQSTSDGKLIVENNSGTAIKIGDNAGSGKDIEIHGGEITAKATGNYSPGIYSSGIRVYGGKLTAESKATMGIQFGKTGGGNNFKVYGGEVYATSLKTTGTGDPHGISGTDTANDVLMVYGGKVNGTGSTGGQGFNKCKLWSATTGIKFYFSDNGTDWDAGHNYDHVDGLTNRYAKAE